MVALMTLKFKLCRFVDSRWKTRASWWAHAFLCTSTFVVGVNMMSSIDNTFAFYSCQQKLNTPNIKNYISSSVTFIPFIPLIQILNKHLYLWLEQLLFLFCHWLYNHCKWCLWESSWLPYFVIFFYGLFKVAILYLEWGEKANMLLYVLFVYPKQSMTLGYIRMIVKWTYPSPLWMHQVHDSIFNSKRPLR